MVKHVVSAKSVDTFQVDKATIETKPDLGTSKRVTAMRSKPTGDTARAKPTLQPTVAEPSRAGDDVVEKLQRHTKEVKPSKQTKPGRVTQKKKDDRVEEPRAARLVRLNSEPSFPSRQLGAQDQSRASKTAAITSLAAVFSSPESSPKRKAMNAKVAAGSDNFEFDAGSGARLTNHHGRSDLPQVDNCKYPSEKKAALAPPAPKKPVATVKKTAPVSDSASSPSEEDTAPSLSKSSRKRKAPPQKPLPAKAARKGQVTPLVESHSWCSCNQG
mmetsp:Transcript_4002/g.9497  ORF Transcript_4002/g.9497 Transcript_4002/m.9497 type:complete len:272 (+) Transcript_4002:274-1089(+)